MRPELRLEDLRGNVDTRLRRLREGRFDAILLAMAGLARLGRADEATEILDPRRFVPAPGQGAIALECREGDTAVRAAVAPLDHAPTARAVSAERAFLERLGGGCNVPLGAHAFAAGAELELVAFVASPDGGALAARGAPRERSASARPRARRRARRAWRARAHRRPRVSSLDGRRLVVTRQKSQAGSLVERLLALGASVVEVPSIEIVPPRDTGALDAALDALDGYDWVVLTSSNAVNAVLSRLTVLGLYPRLSGDRRRVASVGPATTAALRASFPEDRVALEPKSDFRAAGLVAAFAAGQNLAGRRVLVPASTEARDELPPGFVA